MIGGGFQHVNCSSENNVTKHMEWNKHDRSAPISIHIDHEIFGSINTSKKNFAWIHESKSIIPNVYELVKNNVSILEEKFLLLFTHDQKLASLSPKFIWIKWKGNTWIVDKRIYKKNKLISMIASNKVMCNEHIYRQKIVNKYKDKIDIYGNGINPIEKKEEGLSDYCFSIAMENHTYLNSYSEKITDCFATGTVPIYYGTPGIGEIWNSDGIIKIDDFNLEDISFDLYHSMLPAINDNFERVMNMPVCEDFIFTDYIKPLIG